MACPIVGEQVDLTLLLLLQPAFSSSMMEGATVVKDDEDGPEQPGPAELIAVGAVVTTLTEVGLVVHTWAKLSKLPLQHLKCPPGLLCCSHCWPNHAPSAAPEDCSLLYCQPPHLCYLCCFHGPCLGRLITWRPELPSRWLAFFSNKVFIN